MLVISQSAKINKKLYPQELTLFKAYNHREQLLLTYPFLHYIQIIRIVKPFRIPQVLIISSQFLSHFSVLSLLAIKSNCLSVLVFIPYAHP